MLENVYGRVLSFAITPLIGMLPAWLMGFIVYTDGFLWIDGAGLTTMAMTGIIGSMAIFAKWGIKPTDIVGDPKIFGSLMRVIFYGVSTFVAMLPADWAGLVQVNVETWSVTLNVMGLATALLTAMGMNLAVLSAFGVKKK